MIQNKITAGLILAATVLLPRLEAATRTPATVITIDESKPIKSADARLLGFNYEWAGQLPVCALPSGAGYDPQVVEKLRGLPLPLNRMSGTPANVIKWKEAIGPMAQRSSQKLAKWWKEGQKIGLGPVEWIKMVRAIDPKARFTWTVNLSEPPEDTADLVEFLTGDGKTNPNGGVNWAQRRIDLGLAKPVDVDVWELGNELDGPEYREKFKNIITYTDLCKKHIAAIRSVAPKAKIAAHAATFSSLVVYAKFFGGSWEIWHRTVLKEIGPAIDYLAFHPYYNSLPASRLENDVATIARDIRSITGSDRIKIYISEHAWWPKTDKTAPGTQQWQQCWYTTHALIGCLATADWVTRMMNSPAVQLAAYHSFSGGPWGLIYKSEYRPELKRNVPSPLYTTGVVDLYRLLNEAFRDGVKIVPVNISGPDTDRRNPKCRFAAAAMTTGEGLNLILVNSDPDHAREFGFAGKKKYRPAEAATFSAPDLLSYDTSTKRPITVKRQQLSAGTDFTGFTVPAQSLVVLKLKRYE